MSMQAFMSGRPRDECLEISKRAYQAVIDNFNKTGALDIYEEPTSATTIAYQHTKQIWNVQEVEVVSREFFEQRVAVKIGIEADESSISQDSDIPDLEKVEDPETAQQGGIFITAPASAPAPAAIPAPEQ